MTKKYNPGFLTDDELVASFCVRSGELESILEMLRECDGRANPHRIVLGPRGCGKTSLLLRVAAEIRRTPALSSSFFPVVFAEESYEVATAGEFWLEALSRLAAAVPRTESGDDMARTFGELRTLRDDRTLRLRCLGALLDFADRENRRLVLMVENLNMMFRDMADRHAGWQLRQTLQTEPRIVMLASATSRFDEIDNPKRAFYELFTRHTLRPLDAKECAILWEKVSGQRRPPKTIGALRILTGGSPRLLTIMARFGAGLSFRELMDDLLNLVDDHTEYFRSHIEALPAQERRVYLALADLWEPASAREVADRARIDTNKCSAQLKRLIDRGVVEIAGGSPRRKLYYLVERLYNIYYLMRRSREPGRVVKALIRFMAAYYFPSRLKDSGAGIAREGGSFDTEMEALHRVAFGRLIALPVLAPYRDELLSMVPKDFAQMLVRKAALPDTALGARPDDRHEIRRLLGETRTLFKHERFEDALAILDEIERRFNEGALPNMSHQATSVLLLKGMTLGLVVGREEEALAACDEVVRRLGDSESPDMLHQVAASLVFKSHVLSNAGQVEEALAACDEVVRRFADSESPNLLRHVAASFVLKGSILNAADQLEEALAACDEAERRFGDSESPDTVMHIALSYFIRIATLRRLNRTKEALVVCDEMERKFWDRENPALHLPVSIALLQKAEITWADGNYSQTIKATDRLLERCNKDPSEQSCQALLIRARARLAVGDLPAAEQDLLEALAMLPEFDSLLGEGVEVLMAFCVELGPARSLDIITTSPSAPLLLPLTTALERELGKAPRVAREIEEIAEDIRRDLEERRRARQ